MFGYKNAAVVCVSTGGAVNGAWSETIYRFAAIAKISEYKHIIKMDRYSY